MKYGLPFLQSVFRGKATIPAFIILLIFGQLQSLPLQAQGENRTTLGGYGEIHYTEPDGGKRGQIDFHRLVFYVGHAFSNEISFNSEIEIEHTRIVAGKDEGGEVAIEQAYLDWRFGGTTGLRAGIILSPVGIINEHHEPPSFNGVERPNVDKTIIPSTWREAGIGLYGELSEEIRYQAYVTAGLSATGFTGSGGIRGGRQQGFRSDPVNPSFTGRIEFLPDPALKVGASWFAGGTTGGVDSLGSGTLLLFSGDVQYRLDGLSLRGVGVITSLTEAEKINNSFRDMSGALTKKIGDRMYGWYGEAGYDIMPHLDGDSEYVLDLFIRYEKYNTQSEVTGFTADPRNDRNEITIGTTFRPTYNTAFKIDYQFFNNAADMNTSALNVGVGFNF